MERGGGRDPSPKSSSAKKNHQRGDSVENGKDGRKPDDSKKSNITINTKPHKEVYNITKSIYFNYSDIDLSDAMQRLLNRGLNFSILPFKLDITQTLVEFRKYERTLIWHEFHYGSENNSELEEQIFREEKTNMPTKYSVPEGLKAFLSAIKSEIQDPRNRNEIECNLPIDELQALKELIRLQKERIIVIKACDKGAGVIILNFQDYMKTCYDHLLASQSNNMPYYSEVTYLDLEKAKIKIKKS